MVKFIGEYPHGAISYSNRRKQTTRMIKVVCPACDYTVRVSQKWIEVGLPTCACGEEMEVSNG